VVLGLLPGGWAHPLRPCSALVLPQCWPHPYTRMMLESCLCTGYTFGHMWHLSTPIPNYSWTPHVAGLKIVLGYRPCRAQYRFRFHIYIYIYIYIYGNKKWRLKSHLSLVILRFLWRLTMISWDKLLNSHSR